MPRPHIPKNLRLLVIERACGCCEFCLVPQLTDSGSHQIDHLLALKHGGLTIEGNLAFACIYCNKHKGTDIGTIDPDTGEFVFLFNPRTQNWLDHFKLHGVRIVGITATGRATVRLLQLNEAERLFDRQVLWEEGLYPPEHILV